MSNTQTLLRTPGERLAKARHNADLTQAQIAKQLGISTRSVSRYEDGLAVVRPQTVMAWAHITDTPLEWLLNGAGAASDIPIVTDREEFMAWLPDMHDPPCPN